MQNFLRQLLREFLRRTFYGSVIVATLVWLLVTSSAWKAAGAAFAHTDAVTAVAVSSVIEAVRGGRPSPSVVVVAIDDEVYRDRFGSRSPLDRSALHAIAQDILANTPASTRLAVDLDVSPLELPVRKPGAAPVLDPLDRLWLEHRDRVVLALPAEEQSPVAARWIEALGQNGCGVAMASPDLPEVFGLVDVGHDLSDSLAARTAAPHRPDCREGAPAGGSPPARRLMPTALDPELLATPLTLPAREGVGELLRALRPDVVVLGGTWGAGDVFRTPFGQRYGVQVHAAMISGHLKGRFTAPAFLQMLAAIFTAALAVTTGRALAQRLAAGDPPTAVVRRVTPGSRPPSVLASETHLFAQGALRRLVVLAWLVVLLILVLLINATVNATTGVRFATLILIGTTAFSVVSAWVVDITRDLQVERPVVTTASRLSGDAGLGGAELTLTRPDGSQPGATLRDEFFLPFRILLTELGAALSNLSRGATDQGGSRWTALRHLILTLCLLLGRTCVPLGSITYLLMQ